MTYYVAKSGKYDHRPYICIDEACHYCWYRNLDEINPNNLTDSDYGDNDINQWLSNLPVNGLTLLYSFTRESHPELFI